MGQAFKYIEWIYVYHSCSNHHTDGFKKKLCNLSGQKYPEFTLRDMSTGGFNAVIQAKGRERPPNCPAEFYQLLTVFWY